MPNNSSVSRNAYTAFCGTGLSTMLNNPHAPVKSRFHSAWPGWLAMRRMQQPQHLGPLLQPARHGEAGW